MAQSACDIGFQNPKSLNIVNCQPRGGRYSRSPSPSLRARKKISTGRNQSLRATATKRAATAKDRTPLRDRLVEPSAKIDGAVFKQVNKISSFIFPTGADRYLHLAIFNPN